MMCKEKAKICQYCSVVLAVRDSLYRDETKPFRAVGGTRPGRRGYKQRKLGQWE